MKKVLLAIVTLLINASLFGADAKPNILFIFTDDQSSRTISSYPEAYDWAHTPNIDQLARTGIRFEHAYLSTWCMPARATMLTGLYQHNIPSLRMVGPYPGAEYDPNVLEFWPKIFRKNGYTTGHIGKWHIGTDTGYGRDWDYQYAWIRPVPAPGNSREYYVDQTILENGKKIGPVDAYATDNYTDRAIEFIKGEHRNNDNPWYLWLCYTAIHGPFTPADRHLNEYEGVEIPVPADIYPPRPGKPKYSGTGGRWRADDAGVPRLYTSGQFGETLYDGTQRYHQAAIAIDENVGRLIRTLKSTEQLENTLVVYTSDQGFAWGQHGFRHKLAPYASNIRVPLIVSMPGTVASGEVCSSPVGGIDLVPTFVNFAGLELPWKMDGKDLTPLLKRPDRRWDRPVFMSFTYQSYRPESRTIPRIEEQASPIPWYGFVIKDRFKFIQTYVEDEIPELYHIDNDPHELHNLALLPQYREIVKQHRQLLVSKLKRTNAGFVDSLPSMKGF
jgi:arylsulfatase A-like enzyme